MLCFQHFSQGPFPMWVIKPQPLCSWDTRAQSPLPFNLTLKCTQTVLFSTHNTFPLCHELQMCSSFHNSSQAEGSCKPGRGRVSWAAFRPVAASSDLSAPSPGSQPPQHDSLLLFHCSLFPIRVQVTYFFQMPFCCVFLP